MNGEKKVEYLKMVLSVSRQSVPIIVLAPSFLHICFRFGSCPIKNNNKKLRKMLALFRDIADDSQVQKGLGGNLV